MMSDSTCIRLVCLLAAFMTMPACDHRSAAPTTVSAQATPTPPSPAPAPAKAAPAVDEDAYTAHGDIPEGVDAGQVHGDAYFFTAQAREGKPVAVVPVTVDGRTVTAVYPHHHRGQAMITEVRLESPTLAPWWSIAWPDGKLAIGRPLTRADAVRLHGTLVADEDGAALADVRIFGDIAGTILGRSDDQGRFECWVPKHETQAHLLPFASTLVGHSRFIDATTYDDQDLVLRVEHGVRVRFRVTDPDGKPLPGATVIWTGGASYQGKTDANGEVAIGMVSRTAPHEPIVELRGYRPVKPVGQVVAGDHVEQPVVIVLEALPGGQP